MSALMARNGRAQKAHYKWPGRHTGIHWSKCGKARGLACYTWDKRQVTCKTCLRQLKREKK